MARADGRGTLLATKVGDAMSEQQPGKDATEQDEAQKSELARTLSPLGDPAKRRWDLAQLPPLMVMIGELSPVYREGMKLNPQ